ncbi:MAG: M20/M25/M40 family metallo-hydrolase [Bryobacterales bacterium]|nr:M20/M25/M40 family metallo-hydrolase [Bryobacteraceae bacterium]MDW8130771.1 M20/M25/M40 family metallo-hydrolase [Bryobacterales bacterium]
MRGEAPNRWKTLVAELAVLPAVRECLQWLTREKQWVQEQHLEVCRIPAPTFFEQRRAEWMAAQFRQLGCEVQMDRVGNVIAFPQARPGPLIALTAHLDTVLAPRHRSEITVEPDGRLRGPGVADNGAGLAALLAIARALRCYPPWPEMASGLALVANVGEEGEGNLSGMRHLCTSSPLASRWRAFVVLDGPSTEHITCQGIASRRFEISYSGPGGHSWSDAGAPNPVHALSRAITLFTDRQCEGSRNGSRCSFNFGWIEGGTSVNAIPTTARAKVDLRSEREEDLEPWIQALGAVVEEALQAENRRASTGKLAGRLREIGFRPSGRLPENSPLLACIQAVDAHLGIRSRLDSASTDANIPLSLGIPAIAIGAGGQGGGAHTETEWYHPEGRDLGLKRILLLLCLLLREGTSTP